MKTSDFNSKKENALQSKELNFQIIHSIKTARQKLSIDFSQKKVQKEQFKHQESPELFTASMRNSLKPKENFIDKTINGLKNKLMEVEKEKQLLEQREKKNKQANRIQIQNLKNQLTRLVQKQIAMNIHQNMDPIEVKAQISELKDKIKKDGLELELIREKLKNTEQKYLRLQKSYRKLENQYQQLQNQKQKHIELNIAQKIKFQQEIAIMNMEKQKRGALLKKIEQENICLKRQIHGIFNKDRLNKQVQPIEKKQQQDYEFQIKELTQKFNIKIKSQQKQLNLLRKTLQKVRQKINESEYNKISQYEHEIQEKRQKIIDREKKLTAKTIQIQKLNFTISSLNQTIKEKDIQIKQLKASLNKKDNDQKDLTDQLVKHGVNVNQFKDTFKSLKKYQLEQGENINKQEDNQITFEASFDLSEQKLNKTQKVSRKQLVNKQNQLENKQKINLNEIVTQERALAGLKSNYKKIDSKQMSLNEIMSEIRRKTDKINDLRSKKIKDLI